MKKTGFLLFLLMFIVMMVSVQDRAAAASSAEKGNIPIILDGNELQVPSGAQVTNMNGSVMVPFRVIGENLGFDVKWDQKSQKILINKDKKAIELVVNQKNATVNGKKVDLDNPPQLQKDSVIVPMRFVSEQMGLHVNWDSGSKAVYLTSDGEPSKKRNGRGGQRQRQICNVSIRKKTWAVRI